jgi:hypothetical protein
VADIDALETKPLTDLCGSGRVSSSLPWWSPVLGQLLNLTVLKATCSS